MEEFSILTYKELTNRVERIFHSKMYNPENVLEMAVVIDGNIDKEKAEIISVRLLKRLKNYSEKFKNVRLNIVYWYKSDIKNKVIALTMALTKMGYQDYEEREEEKEYEELIEYLKLFQARSKIIIVISDDKFKVADKENLGKRMGPFLGRKVIKVAVGEEGIKVGDMM